MCRFDVRRVAGIAAASFGLGVLAAFIFPGYFLAFIEAAVVIAAGILLLGKHN